MTKITQGSVTPSVVRAIPRGVPGRYGSIVSAAPPRTTPSPPRTPRASLLDTPHDSRRCEYQPVASIATALPPAGSAPRTPIEQAPCHESASDSAQLAPNAAAQHAKIVGLNSN
jgi:hypothetical protein